MRGLIRASIDLHKKAGLPVSPAVTGRQQGQTDG
jgi:hypothetical protein